MKKIKQKDMKKMSIVFLLLLLIELIIYFFTPYLYDSFGVCFWFGVVGCLDRFVVSWVFLLTVLVYLSFMTAYLMNKYLKINKKTLLIILVTVIICVVAWMAWQVLSSPTTIPSDTSIVY